jgi:hypothetical protein
MLKRKKSERFKLALEYGEHLGCKLQLAIIQALGKEWTLPTHLLNENLIDTQFFWFDI